MRPEQHLDHDDYSIIHKILNWNPEGSADREFPQIFHPDKDYEIGKKNLFPLTASLPKHCAVIQFSAEEYLVYFPADEENNTRTIYDAKLHSFNKKQHKSIKRALTVIPCSDFDQARALSLEAEISQSHLGSQAYVITDRAAYIDTDPYYGEPANHFDSSSLSFLQRFDYLLAMLNSLSSFHQAGHTHGNVKLANFLLPTGQSFREIHQNTKLIDVSNSQYIESEDSAAVASDLQGYFLSMTLWLTATEDRPKRGKQLDLEKTLQQFNACPPIKESIELFLALAVGGSEKLSPPSLSETLAFLKNIQLEYLGYQLYQQINESIIEPLNKKCRQLDHADEKRLWLNQLIGFQTENPATKQQANDQLTLYAIRNALNAPKETGEMLKNCFNPHTLAELMSEKTQGEMIEKMSSLINQLSRLIHFKKGALLDLKRPDTGHPHADAVLEKLAQGREACSDFFRTHFFPVLGEENIPEARWGAFSRMKLLGRIEESAKETKESWCAFFENREQKSTWENSKRSPVPKMESLRLSRNS